MAESFFLAYVLMEFFLHALAICKGCNFLSYISRLGVQTILAYLPCARACEQKKQGCIAPPPPFYMTADIKESQQIIIQSIKRGGKVPSLCWPSLKIKGNLAIRTYQMIINKCSFLYLIYLSCEKKYPRTGKSVTHELKCCPSQE